MQRVGDGVVTRLINIRPDDRSDSSAQKQQRIVKDDAREPAERANHGSPAHVTGSMGVLLAANDHEDGGPTTQ
jgi:hypothetical protein